MTKKCEWCDSQITVESVKKQLKGVSDETAKKYAERWRICYECASKVDDPLKNWVWEK